MTGTLICEVLQGGTVSILNLFLFYIHQQTGCNLRNDWTDLCYVTLLLLLISAMFVLTKLFNSKFPLV